MEHRMACSDATACVALLALCLAGGFPGTAAPSGPATTISVPLKPSGAGNRVDEG